MTSNIILIAEDDNDINHLLAEILSRAGYETQQAYSGTEAKLLFNQAPPALLLLDLMMPGMTGEELIQYIRQNSNVPIIVVSAKESGQDKVNALRLGADDYVTKPFDEDELIARIEANLRRSSADSNSKGRLAHKNLVLNRDTCQVTVAEREVALTAREFAILELLMCNPKKVFTKENIYTSVWNNEFMGDENTVNVHISNLRTKLNSEYIQTVWGIGFKLQG